MTFNSLEQELRNLGLAVHVPIDFALDEDGFLDRRCPCESCHSDFKVLFEDWRDRVLDERVYCPICRYEAEATEWDTPEQKEYVDQLVARHAEKAVHRALDDLAEEFNRRSSRGSGFVRMSMSTSPDQPLTVIPVEAAEEMQQKFTCESCGCRYASVGAAFFCPACGHNSAASTFGQTIATVEKVLGSIEAVRKSLTEMFDKDVAHDSIRHMLENNMGRLVGAFQRLAEALFDELPNRGDFNPRRNVFQNLRQSSDLWEQAGKSRYEHLLGAGEFGELERLFQQRHLLAHRDGIVDQDYIERSGDTQYSVGQRLVVREEAVLRLGQLVAKLGGELRTPVP